MYFVFSSEIVNNKMYLSFKLIILWNKDMAAELLITKQIEWWL